MIGFVVEIFLPPDSVSALWLAERDGEPDVVRDRDLARVFGTDAEAWAAVLAYKDRYKDRVWTFAVQQG